MNNITLSLGGGVEVSRGEYNTSSEESRVSLFTVTSSLSVTAAKSSHVGCLASVSALRSPLKSSVRLTVGETITLLISCIFWPSAVLWVLALFRLALSHVGKLVNHHWLLLKHCKSSASKPLKWSFGNFSEPHSSKIWSFIIILVMIL